MKRKVVLAFLLTGALVLSGCSKTNNSNETSSGSTSTDSSAQGIDVSNMFSDRDKEIGYDEENSTVIKLPMIVRHVIPMRFRYQEIQ